jgi:hypothetical protein
MAHRVCTCRPAATCRPQAIHRWLLIPLVVMDASRIRVGDVGQMATLSAAVTWPTCPTRSSSPSLMATGTP